MPITNPLAALESLNEAISQESCSPLEPFIKLDPAGSAPILDYNLPQSTCYSLVGTVNLKVDADFFNSEENVAPANNFWDVVPKRDLDAIRADLDTRFNLIPNQHILSDAQVVRHKSVALNKEGLSYKSLSDDTAITAARPMASETKEEANDYPFKIEKDYIAMRIKQGYLPVPLRWLSGKSSVKYILKPITPKPTLNIVLHLKMCSFLGDYGAGQTVKTFSLFPGEKTEISIRHFLRNESTKKASQHVLDSFSESSADDLQVSIGRENEIQFGSSRTSTSGFTNNFQTGGHLDFNFGIGSAGFGGEGGHTIGFSNSLNNTLDTINRTVTNATTNHVARADSLRQIDINVESTDSFISEDEETIKRVLENYNKSRVLNFVFRQLLQKYSTVTYLYDVSFSYSNGYPESYRTATLADLEDMLLEIMSTTENATLTLNRIYSYLCNIVDYNGDPTSFIEKITQDLGNCINDGEILATSYVRKKKLFPTQTYDGIPFDGIILSVKDRIVRTPSLVCDALLGQGEALDCYNQKLQDANASKAHLENVETVQRIEIIEGITAAVDKAENYKKVNGNCCDTPQTQIIP